MTTLSKKEQNKVLAALDQLDHADDSHWNKDGSPTVSVVADSSGVKGLTKADLQEIAPDFKRAEQPAKEDAEGEEAKNGEGGKSGGEDVPTPGSHGAEGDDPSSQGALPDNAPREDADEYANEGNPKATDHEVTSDKPVNEATNVDTQPKRDAAGGLDEGDVEAQEELARQRQAGIDLDNEVQAEIEKLRKDLDAANAELDEAMEASQKARRDVEKAQNKVNTIQNRIDRVSYVHHDKSAATVAGYLASQQRVRDELANRAKSQQGEVVARDMTTKLDSAMSRPTGYGNRRPGTGNR